MNLHWFRWRYLMYGFILVFWFVWYVNLQIGSSKSFISIDCNYINNNYRTALVLGAKTINENQVSQVYEDRLQTAVNLYKNNIISKIVISGDHGQDSYDEVNAGKNYLLENGVNERAIFLDHAGFDTYDSVYRAKYIFNIDEMIVITQKYHLPRALYLSNSLGIKVMGCEADLHKYQNIASMKRREIFANIKAWLDIKLFSSPKYKGDLIDIDGDNKKTWDD